ncbi:hypothetical protein J1605_010914 [Eschrichtius robustus]|uniref:Uncharacterized protein n=1 Tax=Eschrichtius robustus TaxID=9764 RepID=A0AB34GS99_ESCRO|nr:hypothetical protein J1605_010914 [Eschrichtius robustus]
MMAHSRDSRNEDRKASGEAELQVWVGCLHLGLWATLRPRSGLMCQTGSITLMALTPRPAGSHGIPLPPTQLVHMPRCSSPPGWFMLALHQAEPGKVHSPTLELAEGHVCPWPPGDPSDTPPPVRALQAAQGTRVPSTSQPSRCLGGTSAPARDGPASSRTGQLPLPVTAFIVRVPSLLELGVYPCPFLELRSP